MRFKTNKTTIKRDDECRKFYTVPVEQCNQPTRF